MGWSSAAAMAAAAAFQDAGRGVGAWLGVEWRGEELEHRVTKQNGERELGRRGRRRMEQRRVRGVRWRARRAALMAGQGAARGFGGVGGAR